MKIRTMHTANVFILVFALPFSAFSFASAYTPAQYPPSYSARPSLSFGQVLVGDSTASDGGNEARQPVQCVPFYVSFVQPERKLIHVASDMLWAGVMIDPVQSTAHSGEYGFNSVGGHGAAIPRVLLPAVIDRAVMERWPQPLVPAMFVSVDGGTRFDILANHSLQSFLVSGVNLQSARFPAAFAHSDNRGFVVDAGRVRQTLAGMFVAFQTADVGFIHFDNSFEHRQIVSASLSQAVKQEPRRCLADTDFFSELHGRNPLASSQQQIHRIDPLVKWHMRPLENGSCPYGESQQASVTAIKAVLPFCDSFRCLARRAHRAVWPKPLFEVGHRDRFIGKEFEKLEGANC